MNENLKKAYADDPEMLAVLEAKQQTKLLREILDKKMSMEGVEMIKGEKGDTGEIGEPGQDGRDGVDGRDGQDGQNGKDGERGPQGFPGENGKDGQDGKDGVNGKDGIDGENPEPQDVIDLIKKKQLLDTTHIKGLQSFVKDGIRYKVEELMHGGGGSGTGGGSPAGPQYAVQFNNPLGTFDGDEDFTFTPDVGMQDKLHARFGSGTDGGGGAVLPSTLAYFNETMTVGDDENSATGVNANISFDLGLDGGQFAAMNFTAHTATDNTVQSLIGIFGIADVDGTGNSTLVDGMQMFTENGSASTVDQMNILDLQTLVTGGGTINTLKGIYLHSPTDFDIGGAILGDVYGLYIEDQGILGGNALNIKSIAGGNLFTGHSAFGADSAVNSGYIVNIQENLTGDDGDGSQSALRIFSQFNSPSDNLFANVLSFLGEIDSGNSSDYTNLNGVFSALDHSGSGVLSNAAGMLVTTINNLGAGSITNVYGIKIEDQVGATNNWAVKTGLGLNEFGDNVWGHAHAAFGATSTIDFVDPSTVLGVKETFTVPNGDDFFGSGLEVSITVEPASGNPGDARAANVELLVPNTSTLDLNIIKAFTTFISNEGTGDVSALYALDFQVGNNATADVEDMYGISADVENTNGTVDDLTGFLSNIGNSGSGTIGTSSHIHLMTPFGDALSGITNHYGILMEDQNVGMNSWAIKTGLGLNEFGDNVWGKDKSAFGNMSAIGGGPFDDVDVTLFDHEYEIDLTIATEYAGLVNNNVYHTPTSFANNIYNMTSQQLVDGHGAGTITAIRGFANYAGDGTVDNLEGMSFFADLLSDATVNTAIGARLNVFNEDIGTIIDAKILSIGSAANLGAGSITNVYGVYVEDQTAGDNNWAIQTGLGLVEFGDDVQADANVDAQTYSVAGTPGDSGTFTTADLKTVTVVNGIITDIS